MESGDCIWSLSEANGRCDFAVTIKRKVEFEFPREVLLVEIERYCSFSGCATRNLIGLTKSEVIGYRGFDCINCQSWNDDRVDPLELPESWRGQFCLESDNDVRAN